MIHCHDMAGGYHEDRHSQGSLSKSHVYNFYYWQYIDIFIYFSHHRVTIPPPGWIEAAHTNGVKILATFITEWEPGRIENLVLMEDCCVEADFSKMSFADKLIDIAKFYKFDGWFFNFEAVLKPEHVPVMEKFLKYITKRCHEEIPGSLVLWYDSVTQDGSLIWQNMLNEHNKMYVSKMS